MTKTLALLVLALPFAAAAQPATAVPPEGLAAFRWFAQLAGACWKGNHPDGKTSDTQCYQSQYGKFMRGTIKISPGAFEGDSVYWYDAKAQKIGYQQWVNNGGTARGEAVFEGDTLLFIDRPPPGTSESTGRTTWKRVDANSFKVTRETRDGKAWKEAFTVVYQRTK